jgi:hypothetical protein
VTRIHKPQYTPPRMIEVPPGTIAAADGLLPPFNRRARLAQLTLHGPVLEAESTGRVVRVSGVGSESVMAEAA